ncbi:MAG TPA: PEP-CTERM sorting domain-containing protein, partial [Opitutaceae bacterium]|nr:PEP-CTERM sorting domain-containing protein [Opitutaceae bacterium]
LTVANWANAVDYFYALTNPGTTNLGRIVFTGFSSSDTKWMSYDNEITPVPEPSVYGAALLGLCTLTVWRRRRPSA